MLGIAVFTTYTNRRVCVFMRVRTHTYTRTLRVWWYTHTHAVYVYWMREIERRGVCRASTLAWRVMNLYFNVGVKWDRLPLMD